MRSSVLIEQRLSVLVDLALSLTHRAGGMRMFEFGHLQQTGDATRGQYALHLQCPWHIDSPEGLITGSTDVWRSSDPRVDYRRGDWEPSSGNMQDLKLAKHVPGIRKHRPWEGGP